jgi:5-formyltetrahydrofolate cyclo-ligase
MPARNQSKPLPKPSVKLAPPAKEQPALTPPEQENVPAEKTAEGNKSVAKGSPVSAPPTLREQKVELRKKMRVSLTNLRGREPRSEKLCAAIVESGVWRRASVIAIFAPMESEPDVELLWPHAHGKTLCYPTIRMGGLDFMAVAHPESVSIGQFGIREPVFDSAYVIPPDEFDLALVPGTAFTKDGKRLGRGGGFYDRFLATPGFRARKIGVCFDLQLVPDMPLEPHDCCVDFVVTESGIQRG